ncbi:MAG: helix-turn-helix domain-containing protein [Proteobacteria bacterium]|nr:helix-turn-helix domain-containing protein [Pseudomonadota bacterium]
MTHVTRHVAFYRSRTKARAPERRLAEIAEGLDPVSEAGAADLVVMRRDAYDALVRAAEDASDLAASRAVRARYRPEDYLPAALVERALAGDSPVRLWREHRGLSARALARKAGLSPAYLSEIETGRKAPGARALKALAAALGVGLDDLVAP